MINRHFNTIEDIKSWLLDIKAFDNNEGLTSRASLLLKKNPDSLKEVQSIVGSSSTNVSELIYNIYNPSIKGLCEICNKPVKFIDYKHGYRKTCSKKCADILTVSKGKETKLTLYRSTSYNNTDKAKATKLEKYGSESFVNSEKARQTKAIRYGNINYNNSNKAKETKLEKYGNSKYNNFEKSRATNLKHYGTEYPQTLEVIKAKQRHSAKKKYLYNNLYFDSSWELAFYIKVKDENKAIIREPAGFKYISNNIEHIYYPDFLVNNSYYEIKGSDIIDNNGIWIPKKEELKYLNDKEKDILKQKFIDKQKCAVANNVIIIDSISIKPYLTYCIKKFGSLNWADQFKDGGAKSNKWLQFLTNRGINYQINKEDFNLSDLEFFHKVYSEYDQDVLNILNECQKGFPYPNYSLSKCIAEYKELCISNGNQKPHRCYDILNTYHKSIWSSSLKGYLSPLEGWNNKDIMIKAIQNRMIYSKKLTPNNILLGLNISKLAPKVSVFNPALARYIIYKYLNDYNTIFDPFSGFSGRMLGACSLNKFYIGQDISPTHIEESDRIKNDLGLNAVLTCADMLNSTGVYDCLFTCPPYNDKEIWGNEIEFKNCDDWITECINRFKCNRYAFVVDNTSLYKDYIKEELTNKSHISTNKEYLIII